MRHDHRFWLFLIPAIAAGVALAFGASFFHDFAPIDDYALIVHNLAIRKPSMESVAWFFTHFDPELYIPLTYISFGIDHLLWGLSPSMFHLHNLVLHGLNALLVACLLRRISPRAAGRMPAPIIIFGALVFAVHPLNTEAVVWIAARKDLLTTFWGLAATLLFLSDRRGMRIPALGCFLFALLSKVSMAPLPVVLFLLSMIDRADLRLAWKKTVPFFALSAVFLVVAFIGKSDVIGSDPVQRLFLAPYAMAAVIGRMIVPINLSVFHQPPALSAQVIVIAAIVPALLILAWMLRRRAPLAAFGFLWMLAFLALPSFNVQTDAQAAGATFAADRYAYLPMVGLLISIAGIAKHISPKIVGIVAVFAIAVCIPLSRMQTHVWSEPRFLYQHALDTEPASVDARIAVVRMLRENNSLEDAFAVLLTGLRYGDDPRLHIEAGVIYAATGRVTEAREQFVIARDRNPDAPEAYDALGQLQEQTDPAAAIVLYDEALAREPAFAQAMVRKAILVAGMGDDAAAERLLRDALDIEPSNRDALVELITILLRLERNEEARTYHEDALLLYPDDPDLLDLAGA